MAGEAKSSKRAYNRKARPEKPANGVNGSSHKSSARTTAVDDDQQVGHLPLPQPIHGDVSELQEHVDGLGDSWETESIFEDIIDDLTHDTFPSEGN
jgi:NAD+-dependent protein deacetylase SIR2